MATPALLRERRRIKALQSRTGSKCPIDLKREISLPPAPFSQTERGTG